MQRVIYLPEDPLLIQNMLHRHNIAASSYNNSCLFDKSRFPVVQTDIQCKNLHALLGSCRPKITEITAACYILNWHFTNSDMFCKSLMPSFTIHSTSSFNVVTIQHKVILKLLVFTVYKLTMLINESPYVCPVRTPLNLPLLLNGVVSDMFWPVLGHDEGNHSHTLGITAGFTLAIHVNTGIF